MKALFVDHAYHNSTKSSGFMLDLLKEYFDVDVIFVEPGSRDLNKTIKFRDVKYDFVVLWQVDWFATYFLRLGIKTIIIPMFDGSSNLDPIHWRVAKDAFFINFSLKLHNIITTNNGNSIYVKYFPDTNRLKKLSVREKNSGDKPTAFFWERRPDTLINSNEVCRMLSKTISHLHIHQAPDPGLVSSKVPENLPFTVSISTWFKHPEEYLKCVSDHDIYVAPRYSEGIGMGFLEAMALGKVVVAHDESTHNEYILNNKNGILFNAFRGDVIKKRPEEIFSMGRNAKDSAELMLGAWNFFYKEMIVNRIRSYVLEKGGGVKFKNFNPEGILNAVSNAHVNWKDYYNFLSQLEHSEVMELNCVMDSVCNFEVSGYFDESEKILLKKAKEFGHNSPYGMFLGMLMDRMKFRNLRSFK